MVLANVGLCVAFSVGALLALFVLTKWMGNRQMSQLTMFDYLMGISIGSIAAEMSIHPEADSLYGFLAMALFAGMTVCINTLNDKNRKVRRLVLGEPLILFDRGTLYYANLKKARLDLTEFMTACRNDGYFDLSQLQLVIFEINGKLSFLPNEQDRPLTPSDMNLCPPQSRPTISVVMDGAVLPERLKATGHDESWLQKQMAAQGFTDAADILLATVDANNALAIYEKNEDRQAKSYYG